MRRSTEQSYLLRLWRDYPDASLRATVVTIGAPQHHHHFPNLDELQHFLITQTSVVPLSDVEKRQPAPTDTTYCTSDSRNTPPDAHPVTWQGPVASKENE